MGRTFIQRLLNALFNRKKEDNAISETKDQVSTRDKARNKTAKIANAKSKANIKEEHKEETEEKIRSCAVEIETCIDLINNSSTGTPGKLQGGRGHAKADDRKADKSEGNRKTSSSNSDSGTKRSKQGVSPAEMVVLLAKVEEKVSEAVVKAKEKDNKKKKERRKK
jgi:hypothetical protein